MDSIRTQKCIEACEGITTGLLAPKGYLQEVKNWQEAVTRAEKAEVRVKELEAAMDIIRTVGECDYLSDAMDIAREVMKNHK